MFRGAPDLRVEVMTNLVAHLLDKLSAHLLESLPGGVCSKFWLEK